MVRRVLEKQKDRPNWFNAEPDVWPYAYEKRVTNTTFDSKGKIEAKQTKKYDIVPITIPPLPFHYRHITTLEIDGQPVAKDKDDARRTSEEILARVHKKVDEGGKKSKPKNKGQGMLNEAQNENVVFWQEFQKAFVFPLLEHRELNGRLTSIYATKPDPSYHPNKGAARFAQFSKFTGEIWIDDADAEIVRFKYHIDKDISGGPFGMLGKVYAGSAFQVDLTKQYKGLWLPSRTDSVTRSRTLLNSSRQETVVELSNYREFITTTTVQPLEDR
jgi:hypothetical protein